MKDFVVIDLETTGVLRHRDRVIEIAMIRLRDNEVTDRLTTLINPDRDLGPTNIHGITAAQVIDAPRFHEVAVDVLNLFADSVVVAHNADFDIGMIAGEFERSGHSFPMPPRICTMNLAYEFGPASRRLEHCCAHFGISIKSAHDAQSDADATLALFQCYSRIINQLGRNILNVAAFKSGEIVRAPNASPSNKRRLRSQPSSATHDFIGSLIAKLPETGSVETASYYAVLDRILEDRRITDDEAAALERVANETGLSKQAAENANYEYLQNLVALAFSDHKLTTAEENDLAHVARLLSINDSVLAQTIEQVKNSISTTVPPALPFVGDALTGKTVCFTGTLLSKLQGQLITRERAEELARSAGLLPVDSITKKTDLLVIADPDSMSGKAKKARHYGTRIMAEQVFWKSIGINVD